MKILEYLEKEVADKALFYMSIVAFLVLVIDWGFPKNTVLDFIIYWFYWFFNLAVLVGLLVRVFFLRKIKGSRRQQIVQYLLLLLTFSVFVAEIYQPAWFSQASAGKHLLVYIIVILLFIVEVSDRIFIANMFAVHPSLIFAASFLILIFFGAILLMLPEATTNGIQFVDALFMATSAVSVTGLTVLDIGTDFTRTGQIIIIILVQIGGLGMLTFTNLFGLIFRGGTSFQNQLFISNTLNAANISNAFTTLVQIVLFTFIIEGIGALVVFSCLPGGMFPNFEEAAYFSIFHAISAFCNAGFSTLSDSLHTETVRHNYPLHLILALLVMSGSIGYTIMINYYYLAKDRFIYYFKRFILWNKEVRKSYRPLVTLNTKLATRTTAWLIVIGFVGIFISEFNGVFRGMTWVETFSNAFFCAVIPRSGGFNTVELNNFNHATIMFILFLMWVGGSPGSTGGGIKTTTFAVIFLNTLNLLLGRERIEAAWREIPSQSVKRALSVILLSIFAMGITTILIAWLEPKEIDFRALIFEVVSACNTVGLSLGISSGLSSASKLVLLTMMFLGRVGMFNLLIGIIRTLHKHKTQHHRYPQEDVFM